MKQAYKVGILAGITLICAFALGMQPAIPQNAAFHHFADGRVWLGIPKGWNVLSNLPFIITGVLGLLAVYRSGIDGMIRRGYALLFLGILLTGAGSAYYHQSPDNYTLVFDRIPMTIVFMAFLSVVIMEWINKRLGAVSLLPLVLLGITSVCWWYYSETIGHGDLRLYLFIQFYPMVIIPVIFILFQGQGRGRKLGLLVGVIGWYVLAKVLEHYDEIVFQRLGFVSGHSLKHLAAAVSTFYLLLFFRRRYSDCVAGSTV